MIERKLAFKQLFITEKQCIFMMDLNKNMIDLD